MIAPRHSSNGVHRQPQPDPSAQPGPEPLLLKPAEAAKALAIGARTLWRLTFETCEIPHVKVGTATRYTVEDLRAWIQRRRTHAPKPVAEGGA